MDNYKIRLLQKEEEKVSKQLAKFAKQFDEKDPAELFHRDLLQADNVSIKEKQDDPKDQYLNEKDLCLQWFEMSMRLIDEKIQ